MHRDLKPANLLMNERWQLVLADFGTSKVLKDIEIGNPLGIKKSISANNMNADKQRTLLESQEQEFVGTEEYISPEALDKSSREVTFAMDLWSFGVIIWQIFSKTNTTPFADES